jgi:hypothetical protein
LPRELKPPSGGAAPPATAELPGGEVVDLAPLARAISAKLRAEYPDEEERYGTAGFDWCVHDNQWLLRWAAEDVAIGHGYFARNVRWLANVLAKRDYPLERLARNLEIAADVVGRESEGRSAIASRLRAGAGVVAPRRRRSTKR